MIDDMNPIFAVFPSDLQVFFAASLRIAGFFFASFPSPGLQAARGFFVASLCPAAGFDSLLGCRVNNPVHGQLVSLAMISITQSQSATSLSSVCWFCSR